MNENFKIVRLLTEHVGGAIDVLRESFFTEEKICNCVRILQDSREIPTDSKYKVTEGSKELEDLAIDTIKDGVSFCAVDTRTNEVLGVAFNKIQIKPKRGKLSYFEEFARNHIKDASAWALVNFMMYVDSHYDFNAFLNYANCYLEIVFLAVKSTAKGRGIGTALVTSSADLGQKMKNRNEKRDFSINVTSEAKEFADSDALKMAPNFVSAIFTSKFSQTCGQRSGFVEILKVPYSTFTYNGKNYSETTGPDHPYCTLSIKSLD